MLGDLLLADLKGLLLALFVYLSNAQVVAGRYPHHGAQRLHHGGILDHVVAVAAVGDLKTLARLDDDLLPRLYGLAVGGEKVALAPVFEFYAYNFSQLVSSFPLPTSPPAIQICVLRPY